MKRIRKVVSVCAIVFLFCALLFWFRDSNHDQLASSLIGTVAKPAEIPSIATAPIEDHNSVLPNEALTGGDAVPADDPQSIEERLRSAELLWWPQSPAATESLIADLLSEWDGLLSIDSISCNETTCKTYYRAISQDSMPDFLQSEKAKSIGIRGYTPAVKDKSGGISEGVLAFSSHTFSNMEWTEELFLRTSYGTLSERRPTDTRPNFMGTFNGADVVQLVDCSYGCPQPGSFTITLIVPEDSTCNEVGGIQTILQSLTPSGIRQVDACVPRVIAERQSSPP